LAETTSKQQFTGLTERQRAFLEPPRYGTVATLRPDGTPMLFTVWYDLDGDDIWFVSRPDLAKIRQLEHDPRIAFHIVAPSGFPYLAVNGTATVTRDDAANTKRLHMATRYNGAEGGKLYVRENPVDSPGAIIRITIERVNGML